MSEPEKTGSECERLEALWHGRFGDAYVERNRAAGEKRRAFWSQLLTEYPVADILEVGCNVGANLRWIALNVEPHRVYGVDVNLGALEELRRSLPGVNALYGVARALPFRDHCFDMVFTAGVLIHQPEGTLPLVLGELVRCSRRYVLCAEYYAGSVEEIPYRGQQGALFKRDYGRLYLELFPELVLLKQGVLDKEQGFDDVTYWLFRTR
ncbi:MAG: pseudaminic acid biosynthesis-associated methylase [Planctomycetota bacterium]|jgi:pseudaminic acid biosynthesis-associated methylase